MADIRIKWEAPLNQAIVDSIAIYRYDGITTDCAEVSENGVLLTDTLASDSTVYDDLDTPGGAQVFDNAVSTGGRYQYAIYAIKMSPSGWIEGPSAYIGAYT